ncbi:aspartyl/asparaginyl beta-hydroxylase domain-containing protein [Nocardia sp. NPDC051570]|uniref:aspartyl/asparaginyl beta-hydroxylase domain-containing protein n=1 Tax=Nocardia sp. NPDC051570 TaxID=3364324 RepID=UPI0037937C17
MHTNFADSLTALEEWADREGVDSAALDRIFQGLREGEVRHGGHLQEPAVLIPGLTSAPWHEPEHFPWIAVLEENYAAIRVEFERQFFGTGLDVHPESQELALAGRWSTYHFFNMGERFVDHLDACPNVSKTLASVPGAELAGMCYFSAMAPGTRVKPHCGFINSRIRCHLGIVVPSDCWMRVGTETRTWTEGKCLVFDDSYEHEVSNNSGRNRAVLLLDTWHPDLSDVERRAIAALLQQWRSDVD